MYTEARKLNVQSAVWAFAIHYDFCPRVAKQGVKKKNNKISQQYRSSRWPKEIPRI